LELSKKSTTILEIERSGNFLAQIAGIFA